MQTHYHHWPLTAIALTSLMFAGCSSQRVIPETGPDILEVYEQHMSSTAPVQNMMQAIHNERRDLAGYTREAGTELNNLFPKLPNPELVMYVFPHLTAKGRPVPGYATAFTLYEADQYAMPGEIAP